jgi:hypothetical protein
MMSELGDILEPLPDESGVPPENTQSDVGDNSTEIESDGSNVKGFLDKKSLCT